MTKTNTFIELYNKLDSHMRTVLKTDQQMSHAKLLQRMAEQDTVFAEHHSRLQAYRALRNALVHTPWSGDKEQSIAEPHNDILKHYRSVVDYVIEPPPALHSIAVPAVDISSVTWNTLLAPTINLMRRSSYRLMPIIESGVLVGIFDLVSVVWAVDEKLSNGSVFSISPTDTFQLFQDVIGFSQEDPKNADQSVIGVRFVSEHTSIIQLEREFHTAFDNNQLITVVCITPNGCAFEPLLGIVTAHDLPSANGHVKLS